MSGGSQGRSEIRDLLDRHGHRPNRALGQHFLADPNIVDRIVRTARVGPGDRVVEVGAGTGTLTRALADTGARVVAYEVDSHLGPLLAGVLAGTGVDLRIADATVVELAELATPPGWVMVANLPYNVGTPLLLDTLRSVPGIERFVVMVQREVADRLTAPPGSRVYGLPSVVVGLRGEVALRFTVPPGVFVPTPAVDSAVVELARVTPPPLADRAEELAAVAFAGRRKMLRRSLAASLPDPDAILTAAGIDPSARPETVSPLGFAHLAEVEAEARAAR